jgi:glycosyltransferase involved in cell wall biosynthesis
MITPEYDLAVVGGGVAGLYCGMHAARDSRVRWLSEPDRGISEAFNKGIRLAAGKIVGIINSDDCYAPKALALVAKCYAAHPDCDVFHGDIARFQGDRQLFLLKPSDVPANIWHEMPLNHPATFVRRKTYELVGGFDTGLRFAMDYELILRIYRAGCCFQYIDQVLANMRYGGASDVNFLSARIEVYNVTVAAGYSRWKTAGWFVVKVGLNIIKNLLRKFGLYSLIRLHPKFARYKGGN